MRTYHWILTLQFTDGLRTDGEGTVDAGPAATRQAVFRQVRDWLKQQAGRPEAGAMVVFFSLEPNDLPR